MEHCQKYPDMNKKNLISIFFVLSIVIVILYFLQNYSLQKFFLSPRIINTDPIVEKYSAPDKSAIFEIIAKDLQIPWDIAFLPSGDLLVTERAGKLTRIGIQTKVVAEIDGVKHIGEGGLLGIALHPNFLTNKFIYLYSTSQTTKGIMNRVERYRLSNDSLSEKITILEGIKGSKNHDGGHISFGPDGYLYITTGDAEVPNSAQESLSLNGKILRIKDDGAIPVDNPFGNAVYSMGHRNPQGLAWDAKGNLWETEHGPSGTQTGFDELNRIQKGGNYGWPILKGDQIKEGYIAPTLHSGSNDTWAPAGLVYFQGSLFFTGLRGEALYEAKINEDSTITLSTHFKSEFGRLRALRLHPDMSLYVSTSNTDGRGFKKKSDDKIIKIEPMRLFAK